MSINDVSIDRRTALTVLGVAGAGATLAGCTHYNNKSGSSGSGGTGGSSGSIKTSDIPVGGGKILGSVVVTQPTAGTFKAFSSTCTHQGCTVASVQSGQIICPCHGSEFSIADGSVSSGPARQPLPEKTVTVSGDALTIA